MSPAAIAAERIKARGLGAEEQFDGVIACASQIRRQSLWLSSGHKCTMAFSPSVECMFPQACYAPAKRGWPRQIVALHANDKVCLLVVQGWVPRCTSPGCTHSETAASLCGSCVAVVVSHTWQSCGSRGQSHVAVVWQQSSVGIVAEHGTSPHRWQRQRDCAAQQLVPSDHQELV
jgi:hypothetical protein